MESIIAASKIGLSSNSQGRSEQRILGSLRKVQFLLHSSYVINSNKELLDTSFSTTQVLVTILWSIESSSYNFRKDFLCNILSCTIKFNSSSSSPKSGQTDVLKCGNGWVGGYKSNYFIAWPFDMVIFPDLQLMFTSAMAYNHGLPKMTG